jgi:hypothetical protein
MTTLIYKAKDFAHRAHDSINHTRKYTGEPYWVHTDAVAAIVAAFWGTEEMVAAAHMHDWLEDVYPALIKAGRFAEAEAFWAEFNEFPAPVRLMVIELAHFFTTEAFPELSRKIRKGLETGRLRHASNDTKTIKIADLADNTVSIVEHDAGFAKTYLAEKEELLDVLAHGGNVELSIVVHEQLERAKKKIDTEGAA